MEKITDLLGAEVLNEEGMYLGRVLDLRCEGEPEHGLRNDNRPVTELLYGKNGPLQFLGLRRAQVNIIPWTAVKKFAQLRVIVDMSNVE